MIVISHNRHLRLTYGTNLLSFLLCNQWIRAAGILANVQLSPRLQCTPAYTSYVIKLVVTVTPPFKHGFQLDNLIAFILSDRCWWLNRLFDLTAIETSRVM